MGRDARPRLVASARRLAADEALFAPGARVLCALSGGADSVALLFFLWESRRVLGLEQVAAAHFHHGLRGADADEDEAFVRSLCAAHGISLTVGRAAVRTAAAACRMGIEETARALRYAFLAGAARAGGFGWIATGHTAGDNAETVLLHLARGAGLPGLTGIPAKRTLAAEEEEFMLSEDNMGIPAKRTLAAEEEEFMLSEDNRGIPAKRTLAAEEELALSEAGGRSGRQPLLVVRPLLTVTRAEVEAFLRARALPHREDLSNGDRTPARNRVRHEAVPALRTVNPKLEAAVSKMTALLRADEAFLAEQAARALPEIRPTPAGLSVDVGALWALPPALRTRAVRLLWARALGRDAPLPLHHVESVLALCVGASPSAAHHLPDGLTARREYGALIVGPPPPAPRAFTHTLRSAGETPVPEVGLLFVCRTIPPHTPAPPGALRLRAETLAGAPVLRPRREGDTLSLPGRPGGRTLKRLMIDRRVPRPLREALPVLADADGAVAAPFFGVDRAHAAAPDAPALLVTVHPLPDSALADRWRVWCRPDG
ncbi:MAG: tRNA lysidine(34) synthetase TilS [Oscillospiraceae bacterium]|jgi:tRNA(Ile)-lysidine synthase|nr:tRNA lysidine(34) synthetase TilS [Oscillospiraceae bacterium]